MQKNKRKKRNIAIAAVVFSAGLVFAGWFYVDSLAYRVCRVEAGGNVTPADFLKKPDPSAVFVEGTQFDTSVPGEYQVKVKSGRFVHRCRLIVADTVPPSAVSVPGKIMLGETCEPSDMISELSDATAVTCEWKTAPDFERPGSQTVTVALTDLGGNVTELSAELFISRVVEEMVMEAGGEIPAASDFVLTNEEASFETDIRDLDVTQVGEYAVRLKVAGVSCDSLLKVEDTVPPQLAVHDMEGFCLTPQSAMEFVDSVEDVTPVTVVYDQEPDWTLEGQQEVRIAACDAGGNRTVETVMLTLQADTEAPVIGGAVDRKIYLGDSISYRKNITVTDNSQTEPALTVDASGVNLQEPGVYPVVYTATDSAGNTASVTVHVTVAAREYSQEEVDALADEVLSKIITEEMTLREKAEAIFEWVTTHVAYISHSDGDDWVKSAYEGLALRKGDCRVYAFTSKELLTRAGIPNMDIQKIPAKTMHFWNLVDVGDGWLHFDTCPRAGGPRGFFLWTDAELKEYSDAHHGSHNYDRDAYPQIN